MQAVAVIEALDVLEDRGPRLGARVKREVIEPLGLDRVEETLDRGVVVTVAGTAHAADDAVAVEDVLVPGTGVRTAAIAVMYQAGERAPCAQRLVKRLERERLSGTRPRGPADDAARASIEENREEEPALTGANLRDVGEPETVRRRALEVLLHAVGGCRKLAVARGDVAEALRRAAPQAFALHESGDAGACRWRTPSGAARGIRGASRIHRGW